MGTMQWVQSNAMGTIQSALWEVWLQVSPRLKHIGHACVHAGERAKGKSNFGSYSPRFKSETPFQNNCLQVVKQKCHSTYKICVCVWHNGRSEWQLKEGYELNKLSPEFYTFQVDTLWGHDVQMCFTSSLETILNVHQNILIEQIQLLCTILEKKGVNLTLVEVS